MLLLICGDLLLLGGVLGRGGVRGLAIGDLTLGGVRDLDFLCLLIGLCLEKEKLVSDKKGECEAKRVYLDACEDLEL